MSYIYFNEIYCDKNRTFAAAPNAIWVYVICSMLSELVITYGLQENKLRTYLSSWIQFLRQHDFETLGLEDYFFAQ